METLSPFPAPLSAPTVLVSTVSFGLATRIPEKAAPREGARRPFAGCSCVFHVAAVLERRTARRRRRTDFFAGDAEAARALRGVELPLEHLVEDEYLVLQAKARVVRLRVFEGRCARVRG